MGRLIDADKLLRSVKLPYIKKIVGEQKTVDAIPVDWIKAYIEDVDAMPDKLVWGHDKNAILTMLRAWKVRKEQNGKAD